MTRLRDAWREAWERNGEPTAAESSAREPRFRATSWSGALVLMCGFVAILWIVNVINAHEDYRLNRFGLRPREIDGLWGILTTPFLHAGYGHLLSNTAPVLLIGWVLLLSGVRTWLIVTAAVVVVGDFAAWLAAPSGLVVGASGLVFGWLGYLVARAYFARTVKWIVIAVAVLFFFGTLLGRLLPTFEAGTSWQLHLCGFGAGIAVAAALHPRRARRSPGRGSAARILSR